MTDITTDHTMDGDGENIVEPTAVPPETSRRLGWALSSSAWRS